MLESSPKILSPKRCWLTVGAVKNWHIAFQSGNIWGLKLGRLLEVLWDVLQEGDVLLFYAHKPVGGVVGYGTVTTKFRQESKPLWPDEIKLGRVIYPLRFEFDIEFCLPPQRWESSKVGSLPLKNLVRAGFQPIPAATAHEIIGELSPLDADRIVGRLSQGSPTQATTEVIKELSSSLHDEIKRSLVDIGKIQKFLADPEYPFDGGRLDVVWRRVEKSVPTYVFEVQVAGDIYHALAKLKHAFHLWNSHIFLVAEPSYQAKTSDLLGGTFHEIRERLIFIPIGQVRELHLRKRAYKSLETELGIP